MGGVDEGKDGGRRRREVPSDRKDERDAGGGRRG